MSMRSPLIFEVNATVPGAGTTAVQTIEVGEIQESSTLTEFSVIPVSAVAAQSSSYRVLTLYNRGTDGSGTVAVATIDTSVTGFTANDERIGVLATAANLLIPDSGVLALVETVVGSGVAHGGYKVTAKASRT